MKEEYFSSEFSGSGQQELNGSEEFFSSSEYGKKVREEFSADEINPEYINPPDRPSRLRAAALKRKKSRIRLFTMFLTSTAGAALIAAAALLSVFVSVVSFAAGPDFLSFTFGVSGGETPLLATLSAGDPEPLYSEELRHAGNELTFVGLEPHTEYTLRVIRLDTEQVLFEKTYMTQDGAPAPLLTLRAERIGCTELTLEFETNIKDPDRLRAEVNGTEAELSVSEGTLTLSACGFTERETAAVRVTDEESGTVLFEKEYITPAAPAARLTETDRTVDFGTITVTLEAENPFGHPLEIRASAGTCTPEFSGDGSHLTVTLSGLAEASDCILAVIDETTGERIFEQTYTTSAAGDAALTLTHSEILFFDIALEFSVRNPAGHPLRAEVNGTEQPLTVSGDSAALRLSGLAEQTAFRVGITDVFTGGTVYSGVFSTAATPPAEVRLNSFSADFFTLTVFLEILNPYGHTLTAALDGEPVRLENGTVSCSGLAEGSVHSLTVTDASAGTLVFGQSFTTRSSGGASVTLTQKNISYFSAALTFTADNPAGHTLSAALDGVRIPITMNGNEASVTADGLEEGTDYRVSIRDENTGAEIWSGTVTTPATPSAEVTLRASSADFFSLTAAFTVSNPYSHALTLRFDDGAPQDLSETEITFTGLAEGSRHTVTVTDQNTGVKVFEQTFTTKNAGNAAVSLTKSEVSYFDISLTFSVTNPAGHKLTAAVNGTAAPITVSGSSAAMTLTGLAEKTAYSVTVTDSHTGAAVYSGSFTTPATPSATVTLRSSSADYFSLTTFFTVSNPYSHRLTLRFDDGAPQDLSETETTFTGLAEGSRHTVAVTDQNTGVKVFEQTFTTKNAGNAAVSLTKSEVSYFDISLTFSVTNPAGHKLTAAVNGTAAPITVSGSSAAMTLTGLAEKTAYSVTVTDSHTGAAVYSGSFTTPATPSATVTLRSSSTDCFSVRASLNISNPYSHTLTMKVNGRESAASSTISLDGLTPRTEVPVTVTDKNTGKTVFSRTFTTNSSVTFTQDAEDQITFTTDPSFYDAYGPVNVILYPADNPLPTDDSIRFSLNNDQKSGISEADVIFAGKYRAEVIRDFSVAYEPVDSFTVELTGIQEIKFRVTRVDNYTLRFTVISGAFPTFRYPDEYLALELYDVTSKYIRTYYSDDDFTITPTGFDIRLDSLITRLRPEEYDLYFNKMIVRYNDPMYVRLTQDWIPASIIS